MPPRKKRHPAEDPDFLADYEVSPNLKANLRRLATDYVAMMEARNNAALAMRKRGDVEIFTDKPWSNLRIDSYVRQRMMGATEAALDAVLGAGEGRRFRQEVLTAYGVKDAQDHE